MTANLRTERDNNIDSGHQFVREQTCTGHVFQLRFTVVVFFASETGKYKTQHTLSC